MGLKVMIGVPRRLASCSVERKRGLLVPVFWPQKKMHSVFWKSSRMTVPTGTPIACGQRDGRALVTHVRAVGEVVAADHAPEQLIHVRGLQRGMTAHVENDRLWVAVAQLATDLGKRLRPRHRPISIAGRIPFQRMCEPAEVFQVVIFPRFQLA